MRETTLKAMGAQLTIDNFGAGFSNLSYLKRYPIDALKIDQSFMHDIKKATDDLDDAALVTTVISLGRSLNLCVIAEGVETREQLVFLLDQECCEGQGFYFSQPVPEKNMTILLRTGRTKLF